MAYHFVTISAAASCRLCGCGEVRERCVLWYAGVPGRRAASDERVVLD